MWGNDAAGSKNTRTSKSNARLANARAVSPVIGIILMISITVILAAVVGVFATSTSPPEERPTTRFEFEFEDFDDTEEDRLRIIHDGGTAIGACGAGPGCVDPGEVFIVTDAPIEDDTGITGDECGGKCAFNFDDEETVGADQEMTAGEDYTIFAVEPEDELEEATVRIVWDDEESEQTATLAVWEGPDA
jgi:flagellin-like protein